MKATKQFLEDAGKSGWKPSLGSMNGNILDAHEEIERHVLDPLAWKAVGKTRGWMPYSPHDVTAGEQEYIGEWLEFQHIFIDHLADGLPIEKALEKISN